MLPAALELGVGINARPADEILLSSRQRRGVARCNADGTWSGRPPRGWARYVAAVAAELARLGRPPVGLEGEVTSTLPIGTGLSSSAALEVAVAVALCAVTDFHLAPLELAAAARRAEHAAVGVPSGIMDQAASLLGRAGHVLLLDTGSLEYQHVPFPAHLLLVVVHSGISRRLEHSGYAERRRELQEGLDALDSRGVGDLRPEDVDALDLPPVPARRLRHVVAENERVRETVRLLRDPTDGNLHRLGAVFRAGHESLRRDFEVTTPELDLLVELAYAKGARAARMTGGGFGGSIVAVAARERAQRLAEEVRAAYQSESGRSSRVLVGAPAEGARELV